MRYFDASALAKRYVREPDSQKVRRLLASGVPATYRLSSVEIVSVLMRRSREGALAEDELQRALDALEPDLAAMLVVELTPAVVGRAHALLRRYSLRAGDAIQLASCLYLQDELEEDIVLVVFDDRLSDAARGEGLTIA